MTLEIYTSAPLPPHVAATHLPLHPINTARLMEGGVWEVVKTSKEREGYCHLRDEENSFKWLKSSR